MLSNMLNDLAEAMKALEGKKKIRSVDHSCWLSRIDTGMRAFSSGQGPGLSSKCSAEVLDGQLVSVVLIFFLSEPVAFRRVYGLESYSRTSGESNHHRQPVSDTRVPRYQLHHEDD